MRAIWEDVIPRDKLSSFFSDSREIWLMRRNLNDSTPVNQPGHPFNFVVRGRLVANLEVRNLSVRDANFLWPSLGGEESFSWILSLGPC